MEPSDTQLFRCLEHDHVFDKAVPAGAPKVLRQSCTCPEHHCAAVAVDPIAA